MFDTVWGWLPVPIDPWAGQVPWLSNEDFDWFSAVPCLTEFMGVG